MTPSANGSANSTRTVSTNHKTPTGNYTLSITGTSGNLHHSPTVGLRVNPNFPPRSPPLDSGARKGGVLTPPQSGFENSVLAPRAVAQARGCAGRETGE